MRDLRGVTPTMYAHACAFDEAADIAMGHTGPGNTVENSAGYTAACTEIARTLRAKAAAIRKGDSR